MLESLIAGRMPMSVIYLFERIDINPDTRYRKENGFTVVNDVRDIFHVRSLVEDECEPIEAFEFTGSGFRDELTNWPWPAEANTEAAMGAVTGIDRPQNIFDQERRRSFRDLMQVGYQSEPPGEQVSEFIVEIVRIQMKEADCLGEFCNFFEYPGDDGG